MYGRLSSTDVVLRAASRLPFPPFLGHGGFRYNVSRWEQKMQSKTAQITPWEERDKERACRNCVKEGAHSGRKRRGREEGIVCGTVAITQTPRIACR